MYEIILSFSLSTNYYRNLTFMGPCIIIVFLSTTNKIQRYTVLFIVVSALHVSSGFSAYRQELKNCTHNIGYMSSFLSPTHPR